MTSIVSVQPGAYIFASYSADWEGEDPPAKAEDIPIYLEISPVVAIAYEPTRDNEELPFPDIKAIYLRPDGDLSQAERRSMEWGEEDVPLGMFSADVDRGSLKVMAQGKCFGRLQIAARRAARARNGATA